MQKPFLTPTPRRAVEVAYGNVSSVPEYCKNFVQKDLLNVSGSVEFNNQPSGRKVPRILLTASATMV